MLARVWSLFLDQVGIPASLRGCLDSSEGKAALKVTPVCPSFSVSVLSVIAWHEWGTQRDCKYGKEEGAGCVRGWCAEADVLTSVPVPELSSLPKTITLGTWSCDLRSVFGLHASKSDLRQFTDLDDMVRQNSPEMIMDISSAGLQRNLDHKEIRIIHGSGDYFEQFSWAEDRTFLINSGGSHHLAAARYIAREIQAQATLQGKLVRHELVPDQVKALRAKYDIYLVSSEVLGMELSDAMRSMRASYFWKPLPRGAWQGEYALFLPKDKVRSATVSDELRERGFFDLGAYLTGLANG